MADIKDKIAKLLALAESPNEAEAKAALLKARELMAKNKLTPEECQKQKNQKVVKDFTDIQCTAMTNPWAASLSAVIADNYCCRAINRKRKGYKTATIGFIGLEDDFEICKRIFLYAYDCIASTCKREIKGRSRNLPQGGERLRLGLLRGPAGCVQGSEGGAPGMGPRHGDTPGRRRGGGRPGQAKGDRQERG